MDGSEFNRLLSSPAVLLGTGALAAIVVVVLAVALRRVGPETRRLIWPIAGFFLASAAVLLIADRLVVNEEATERRAIERRDAELSTRALVPGSMLGCLNSAAGEAVDSACENAVFADPLSVAAAVVYVSAQISLLSDGLEFARKNDPDFANRLAGIQRAIELDRFGIAAHILSSRYGCTAERCPVFALLRDASALKANLRVGAYKDYVARHLAAWKNGLPAADKGLPIASAAPAPQTTAPVASVASMPGAPPNAPSPSNPVPSRFDFPSAASIPPVSIMNPEPKLPAGAASANAAAPAPPGETSAVPMPPHKPSVQPPAAPARPAAAPAPPQQILPQAQ